MSKLTEKELSTIKLLRTHTGNGMMDCKNALEKFNWNFEEAKTYILKQPYPGKILRTRKSYII